MFQSQQLSGVLSLGWSFGWRAIELLSSYPFMKFGAQLTPVFAFWPCSQRCCGLGFAHDLRQILLFCSARGRRARSCEWCLCELLALLVTCSCLAQAEPALVRCRLLVLTPVMALFLYAISRCSFGLSRPLVALVAFRLPIASAYLVAQGHVFVVHSGFSRCLAGAAHGTTFAMSVMLQTVSSLMVHSFLVVSALGRAAHLLLLPLLLLLSLLLFLPYYCHYWLESDVCEHQGFHREQEAFSHIHCPDIFTRCPSCDAEIDSSRLQRSCSGSRLKVLSAVQGMMLAGAGYVSV